MYHVFSLFTKNLVRIAPHNFIFHSSEHSPISVQTSVILIDTSVINVLWISYKAYLNNYVAGMATNSKWRLGARRPPMTWGKVPSGRLAPFHSGRLAPMCYFFCCVLVSKFQEHHTIILCSTGITICTVSLYALY